MRSLSVENSITNYLTKNQIFPFSVLFIQDPKLIKISLFLKEDLDSLLELIKYKRLCDISGITLLKDNTVLFSGSGFYTLIKNAGISFS